MLVDSHCHLKRGENLEEVIWHAKEADVGMMLDVGANINHLPEHLAICAQYSQVYTAVGVHPQDALEFGNIMVKEILQATENDKVIAIGEAGLDYFYNPDSKEAQIELFKKNIAAAQESGLPLVIHNRNSDDDMIRLLSAAYDKKEFKAIVHCYSSSWALAERALEMGFYVSASGIITFAKADDVRENFAKIPFDRLLVETDAPYLAPVPKRGTENEPANVVYTAKKLAEIKGVSFEKIAEITTENFKRLFEL